MKIRRANPGDAAALAALARAIGAEEEGWLITAGEWRRDSDERRFLRAIRRGSEAAVFVAENGDGIVGRASIARDTHPASRHVADVGVMVNRARRRQGVGTMLMRVAEDWARTHDIRKLELHVFPHNLPALELYRRLGYQEEGYRRHHYRRGDALADVILMAKEIG